MMKFVILLCMLLAPGSLAYSLLNSVATVQVKAIEEINQIISDAEEVIRGDAESIEEFRPRLEEGIANYEKEFDAKIKNFLNRVDETLSKVEESDSKCQKLALELSDSALKAVSNASYCIVSKPLIGKQLVDQIQQLSLALLVETQAVKEEALQCTKVWGSTAAEEINCINKASIKAHWLFDNKLMQVAQDGFTYAYLLAVIDIDIPLCIDDDSFSKLTANAEELRVNLEKCIA